MTIVDFSELSESGRTCNRRCLPQLGNYRHTSFRLSLARRSAETFACRARGLKGVNVGWLSELLGGPCRCLAFQLESR